MAELRIENNRVCGSDTVSFYLSDSAIAVPFREALTQFRTNVPKDVSFTIFDGGLQ